MGKLFSVRLLFYEPAGLSPWCNLAALIRIKRRRSVGVSRCCRDYKRGAPSRSVPKIVPGRNLSEIYCVLRCVMRRAFCLDAIGRLLASYCSRLDEFRASDFRAGSLDYEY